MSRPIRILQCIATNEPGGAETVVRDLCRLFNSDCYHAMAIVAGGGWLAEQLRDIRADYETFPYRPFLDLRFIRKLSGLIRERGIDILHCHMSQMNLLGALVGKLAGIPVIATIHGRTNDFDSRKQAFAYRMVGRLCCRTVFVSDTLRSLFAQEVGVDGSRHRVIYNGVDLDRFGISRKSDPIGPARIAMVGSLIQVKDYNTMFDACVILKEEGLHFFVEIAGDGPERGTLSKRIEDSGLQGYVKFTGFQSDVATFLKDCSMYVLSSRHEGFSISIIEAMASYLPVIATRCGGPEEIVVNGRTGLLVPIGDPISLAAAVRFVIMNAEAGRCMGEEGRLRTEQLFSMEKMQDAYRSLYIETIGERL